MGGIVDKNSALAGAEFPRLTDRYQPEGMTFEWHIPSSKKLFRGRPQKVVVEVLDLSVAGALVAGPNIEALASGVRVPFVFEDEIGVAEIRHMREASTGDVAFYGVVFIKLSETLNSIVFDRVAQMRTASKDLDDMWSRAR